VTVKVVDSESVIHPLRMLHFTPGPPVTQEYSTPSPDSVQVPDTVAPATALPPLTALISTSARHLPCSILDLFFLSSPTCIEGNAGVNVAVAVYVAVAVAVCVAVAVAVCVAVAVAV